MAEPEISRRCPSCGASIRERAFFCPQCGVSLGGDRTALETTTYATQPLIEPPASLPENGDTLIETAPLPGASSDEPQRNAVTQRLSGNGRKGRKKKNATRNLSMQEISQPADHGTNEPVSAAQTPIEQQSTAPVEKAWHISRILLGEAAYDPSLRFVLVAALLFLIFVFIVVLSKLV